MLHRMSYREAYFSALKYNFQLMMHSQIKAGSTSRHAVKFSYEYAKFKAATYVFNMKSHDLTSIPVW